MQRTVTFPAYINTGSWRRLGKDGAEENADGNFRFCFGQNAQNLFVKENQACVLSVRKIIADVLQVEMRLTSVQQNLRAGCVPI